jgi:hypothetical protein
MNQSEKNWKGLLPFTGTGIGSLPFLSAEEACRCILSQSALIPFWPQLVQSSIREEMLIQFSPPLPCLMPDLNNKNLSYNKDCDRSEALLLFYEKLLSGEEEFFALKPDYASGFYKLLELTASLSPPSGWIKGQIVGPVTLGLAVQLDGRRFLIHDPELFDTVIKGLAKQAAFQSRRIKAQGYRPIVFIDEPSLSGYGSAFTPLSRDEVLAVLGQTIQLIRESGEVLIGLHCCGNTDWSLLLSLDLDLINLDAFGFGEAFLLYPKEIKRFLEENRAIAWGIVPTQGEPGQATVGSLLDRLSSHLSFLVKQGIDQERLLNQALLTPSCGMGLLPVETAQRLLALLSEVSLRARDIFL